MWCLLVTWWQIKQRIYYQHAFDDCSWGWSKENSLRPDPLSIFIHSYVTCYINNAICPLHLSVSSVGQSSSVCVCVWGRGVVWQKGKVPEKCIVGVKMADNTADSIPKSAPHTHSHTLDGWQQPSQHQQRYQLPHLHCSADKPHKCKITGKWFLNTASPHA